MSLILDPLENTYLPHQLQFFCNQIIDDSDPNSVYIGYSLISGAATAAIWRILKISKNSSTGFTERFWAGGDSAFNKIFSNRAAYTY